MQLFVDTLPFGDQLLEALERFVVARRRCRLIAFVDDRSDFVFERSQFLSEIFLSALELRARQRRRTDQMTFFHQRNERREFLGERIVRWRRRGDEPFLRRGGEKLPFDRFDVAGQMLVDEIILHRLQSLLKFHRRRRTRQEFAFAFRLQRFVFVRFRVQTRRNAQRIRRRSVVQRTGDRRAVDGRRAPDLFVEFLLERAQRRSIEVMTQHGRTVDERAKRLKVRRFQFVEQGRRVDRRETFDSSTQISMKLRQILDRADVAGRNSTKILVDVRPNSIDARADDRSDRHLTIQNERRRSLRILLRRRAAFLRRFLRRVEPFGFLVFADLRAQMVGVARRRVLKIFQNRFAHPRHGEQRLEFLLNKLNFVRENTGLRVIRGENLIDIRTNAFPNR